MGLHHSWDKYEPDTHADYVRGGVDKDDFDKEVNYKKRIKSKTRQRKKRGCPENDFGAHVYVWVPSIYLYYWWPKAGIDDFKEKYGFYRRESKTCCGCGRIDKTRYTEDMQKLIAKKGWYNANYSHRTGG